MGGRPLDIFCQNREIELSPRRMHHFHLSRLLRKYHFFIIPALSPTREHDFLHVHIFHVFCKILETELSPTRELDLFLSRRAPKTNCSSISPLSPARQLDSLHFHYFQFFDTIQEIELSPTPELDLKPPGVLQNLISFSI